MKINVPRVEVQSSAVQHMGKHFDIVLGIDVHWTKTPLPVPLPLPHPFIGLIFDPVEYINISIPVHSALQEKFNLPPSIPLVAQVFVYVKVRAMSI